MTNQAQSRRDRQKGKKGFSKNKGFTLIELMIVVGVMAVIMSLALPSYRTLIEKRQVTSTSEQIAAFLSSAKMEAIKRHHDVRLSGTSDDSSCMGFTSYAENTTGSACDCTIRDVALTNACVVKNIESGDPELRIFDFAESRFGDMAKLSALNVGGGESGAVSFDPLRGMLTVGDEVVAKPLEIKLSSQSDKYALNVLVSPTGRVSICSDTDRAEYAVPGYADCQ